MNQAANPSHMQLLGQLSLEDIYIQQMFDYYSECYEESERYQQFVQESFRIPDHLRSHCYIGVCDRTLGAQIPKANTIVGGAMRGSLQTCGLIIPTGGELFRGCVVFSKKNSKGDTVSAVGYRFGERIRHWQNGVVHWNKPQYDAYVQDGIAFVKEVIYGKANH